MSQEWFPLIITGIAALYAVGVLLKIVWDKHRFEERDRQNRRFDQELLDRRIAIRKRRQS